MLPLLAFMAMPVSPQSSKDSRVAEADREMMVDVAQANLAEIATGKLALDKSQDPKIDKFAQQMIDDHTKALDDLKKIAQSKGVEIPGEPDLAHKAPRSLQALPARKLLSS
ncbi:DUF4142 domain-containing protein [Variovorax sp. MHTC-1]|uniref:DUF4142 domain-containing protein n=1 Tax=Variovorax sp. MHTC-1 TaxID=2495593 RepID=UPI000F8884E1|nr:DUF4142 domain-containing protein [Variovorax sp. MHTC-1]